MAVRFDGVDDSLNFGDPTWIDALVNLTVVYWVNFDGGSAVAGGHFGKATAAGADTSIGHRGSNYEAILGSSDFCTGPATLAGWNHIGWVYDGSLAGNANRAKLYLNGVQQTLAFAGTVPANLPANGNTLFIGNSTYVGHAFLNGALGLFRVYRASLTLAQVQQEMHSWRPTLAPTNLQYWFPLDDGTSARDYSGFGNNPSSVTVTAQVQGPPVSYGAPRAEN